MRPRRARLPAVIAACLLSACASLPGTAPVPATPAAAPPGAASMTQATTPATTPAAAPAAAAPEQPPSAEATGVAAAAAANAEPGGNGLAVLDAFIDGLAEPGCDNAEPRWLRQFAHAVDQVGDPDGDTLALFAHVVHSLRQAGLPTEYALIPFVESGYRPGARSKAGPAGMWQFIAVTARDHGVRVSPGYDERLSPASSTRAAVAYLDGLYGRFDDNWRLALMAYNAGEFRVKRALARSGAGTAAGTPGSVPGLSPVTYAYVEKLHALACLLEDASERPAWRARLDRPVLSLHAQPLEGSGSLAAWAAAHGHDLATLRRLNPGLTGTWPSGHAPLALVPDAATGPGTPVAAQRASHPAPADSRANADATTHAVRPGESVWAIARRYGTTTARLLELNGLHAGSVLRPGMVLKLPWLAQPAATP